MNVGRVSFCSQGQGECYICRRIAPLMGRVCESCYDKQHMVFCSDCLNGEGICYMPHVGQHVCIHQANGAKYSRLDRAIEEIRVACLELPEVVELKVDPDMSKRLDDL